MERRRKERQPGNNRRMKAVLLLAFLIISLLPIIGAGWHARPSSDDYGFAAEPRKVYLETGSVPKTIKEAGKVAGEVYQNWQGSFTACFLMALQPGVWGDACYGLTVIILLGTFLIGNALFFKTFLHDSLGFSKEDAGILYGIIMLSSVHLLPSATESFYWFNGSIYYTFFYALSLILAAGLCKRYHRGKGKLYWYELLLPILAFLIGGSNLVTGLTLAVLFFLYGLFLIYQKRLDLLSALTAAGFYLGFILNVLAPGNGIRMGEGAANGPIQAILLAVMNALRYVDQWSWSYAGLLSLAVLPVAKDVVKKWNFAFPMPLFVLIGSILLIAVGLTPQLYAQGIIAGLRGLNIQFFQWMLLLPINLVYWMGWWQKRREKQGTKTLRKRYKLLACLGLLFILGLRVISLQYPQYEKRVEAFSGVEAAEMLISGEAKSYARERDAWLTILEDPEITDAVLPPLTRIPGALTYNILSEDASFWVNQSAAVYYQKETIRVQSLQP